MSRLCVSATSAVILFFGFLSASALLCVLCVSASSFSSSPSSPLAPQRADPATLPHDQHEGLLVAVDPYLDEARSKEKFGKKHPLAAGLLAVEVIFRNDNDKPLLVELDRIRLMVSPPGGEKQQLAPLAMADVIEQSLHPEGLDPRKPRNRIPGRDGSGPSKDQKKLEATLAPIVLQMSLIPPKSTMRGFLFFDLGRRLDELVPHSRLYVPDVKFMHNKQPLFFFEVDLSKAAP